MDRRSFLAKLTGAAAVLGIGAKVKAEERDGYHVELGPNGINVKPMDHLVSWYPMHVEAGSIEGLNAPYATVWDEDTFKQLADAHDRL